MKSPYRDLIFLRLFLKAKAGEVSEVAGCDPGADRGIEGLTTSFQIAMKTPQKAAILLGPDIDITPQLRWGVHLAIMRGLDLVVFQRIESEDERVVDVPLDEDPATLPRRSIRRRAEAVRGFYRPAAIATGRRVRRTWRPGSRM